MRRRLIARAVATAALATAAGLASAPAWAGGGGCGEFGCTTGGGSLAGTTLSALGGVQLTSSAPLKPGRGSLTGAAPLEIPPCWYQPGLTPVAAVQLVRNLAHLVRANPELWQWFEQYIQPMVAADYHVHDAGLWYVAWCQDFNAPASLAWTTDHPWFTWVAASDPAPPPPGTVSLDPKLLATYAIDSVQLPATTFAFNPLVPTGNPAQPKAAVVNLATWIWLDRRTFGAVTVTAKAGPVTVTATATPTELDLPTDLQSPDGQPYASVTPANGVCTDLYDAYAGNPAAGPACAITFSQSSATEPGAVYPITVRLVWQASYTANFGAGGPLEPGTVAGTVPVPVQELQTTITH